MNYLIRFFAKQHIFSDLVTVFILLVGLGSMFLIKKEVFPNVTFDIITVATINPGASAEDVEKLITNEIERDLKEVDGIKKIQSTSIESRSQVVVQLDPDQTTEREGKSDIQDVVDRLDKLPDSAEEPIVTSIESKLNPIIEISVAGDMPEMELRNIAKDIEDELENVKGVARVVPKGLRDIEIRVEADPKKLAKYRLSLDSVIQSLSGQNVSIPAGTIETSGSEEEKIIRTTGEYEGREGVLDTVIRANDLGQAIRIRDVANVRYALEKADILNRTNGTPAISLTILKKEKEDAIQLVDEVMLKVNSLQEKYGDKIEFSFVNDLSEFIRRRLSILSTNLVVGLSLVLLILSLILPLRVAALVSLGIPFAFFGAMIYFYQAGNSINLISMLGLIIVSGMLVDDAVVVTDNAYRRMEEGEDPEEAAIKGTQQIWPSLTASVFTTILAFTPMLFMSGIFGKFVREIPIGVIIPLFASLIEGYFILPSHISRWIRYKKAKPSSGIGIRAMLSKSQSFWDNSVVPKYISILRVIVKRRYITATSMLFIFISSLALGIFGMRFILFPPEAVEVFFVKAEAPSGTSLQQTMKMLKPIENTILKLPNEELKNVTTTVGIIQQDPNDPSTKRGSQYGMIKVFLEPENQRSRSAALIIDSLKSQVSNENDFRSLTFERLNPGPPVGKPVSIGVRGRDYETILKAVDELKEEVKKIPHVSDVADSFVPGKKEYQVILNQSETAAANLNVASVGQTVRAAYEGIIATSIQRLDEEIEIRVSLPQEDRTTKASLENLAISNPMGALIPLNRISTIKEHQGIASYEHEANKRQVRVTAEIDTMETSSTEVNNFIREEIIGKIQNNHPQTSFYFGGEDEDTKESLDSLFRAFGLAVIGIFFILILAFKNIMQPFLILLTIPLGLISVIVTFYIHGLPLSFMGMLGIVALGGVLVNNAIVFVDFVNRERSEEGLDRFESIFVAAKKRIRPIFLTTLTTVAGVMPTAYGIGGLDKFVVPIALAIAWGLIFGSLLTVFAFPAALAILDDIRNFLSSFKRKKV